jgi:NitT/TauT family transport system ATP-binding protein
MTVIAPAIEVSHLSKTYTTHEGLTVALDGLSFSVAPQEFISLLGPSGCGKTTVLKIVAGLSAATSGSVKVEGRPVKGPHPDVGIVFQTPALMRWRTAIQNVMLPAEILHLDRSRFRQRANELLELVGLRDSTNKLPIELSGGMQQRVSIARALIHDPSILLLDEPFSALDAMTRNQLNVELLRIWSERKKTSLLITHSIPESVFLSDRVVVLSARPAKVLEIVEIPLPRPRTPELRVSRDFIKLVDRLGRLIGLEYA